MDARKYYNSIVTDGRDKAARLRRRANVVSWLRLAVFAVTLAAVIALWGAGKWVLLSLAFGIVLFLLLVKVHDRLLRQKSVQEATVRLAEARLRVLDGDLSKQPRGERYIDPTHRYTFDLDIFGRNSLYSMLDSTATPIGDTILAEWLQTPLTDADTITARQKAIAELSSMPTLRIALHASATASSDESPNEKPAATADAHVQIPNFALPRWAVALSYIAGALFLAAIVLAIIGTIPATALLWLLIFNLLVAASVSKRVSHLHRWLCDTVTLLTTRRPLLAEIENVQFSSPLLIGLQRRLTSDGIPASRLIGRLSVMLTNLDQRYNAISFLLFNGTMLWDILTVNSISRWMSRHGAHIATWCHTLGEIDALSALATYAFECPDYTYPRLDPADTVIMEAEGMGHPLIPAARRVDNTLPPIASHHFMIITGANMAGKSTYLRTVGVNYLLACIGAPVCALSMTFTPATLFTGLRASDSLADGESYFMAELRRLKAVVTEASAGERMFILLDEILRGTNSADKQRGSLALVRRLVTLPVGGLLATHDLALGTLADEFPGSVTTGCFEASVGGDALKFDYTLRPGVARNLNALRLMQHMGIV